MLTRNHAVCRTGGFIVVFCLVSLLCGGVAAAGKPAALPTPPPPDPASPVDYIAWINETFGDRVKDSAHKAYLAAYDKIKPFDGDWGDTYKSPWSDNPDVTVWLKENSRGLRQFADAAKKKHCFFPFEHRAGGGDERMNASLLNVNLQHVGPHYGAARGLLAEGWQAWEKGERKILPNNAFTVLNSAHHMADQPSMLERLIGISCEVKAYTALRKALELIWQRYFVFGRLPCFRRLRYDASFRSW